MKKIKVLDIIKELKEYNKELSISVDKFVDYNNDEYICDIVNEITDNNIDIYTADLIRWASNNYQYIDEAIREFGNASDFLGYIKQAQYLCYSNEIYNNLINYIKMYAYNYLMNNKGIEEMTKEQQIEIDNELDMIDSNDYLSDIECIIDNILDKESA